MNAKSYNLESTCFFAN